MTTRHQLDTSIYDDDPDAREARTRVPIQPHQMMSKNRKSPPARRKAARRNPGGGSNP